MLYELTLEATYFDQQVINRWTYNSSGAAVGITGAAALLQTFGLVDVAGAFLAGSAARAIQQLQPTAVIYKTALVKALYDDPTDFIDRGYAAGVTGASAASNPASPALAYGFRTNRTRTDIARGTKRLVGVDESTMANGGIIESSIFTALNNIASLMSADLSYTTGGSSLTFKPCVLGREKIVNPPDPTVYKLYPTLTEQLEHVAEGIVWTPYEQVRTQVSRQYGHGR